MPDADSSKISTRRNMTWNGMQGFQTPIEDESFLVDNMGVFGNTHNERGLTCEFILFLSNSCLLNKGVPPKTSSSTTADI